jgi:hypothetical protein
MYWPQDPDRAATARAECRVEHVPLLSKMEASTVGSVRWMGATSPVTKTYFITSLFTNIGLKNEYSKLTS